MMADDRTRDAIADIMSTRAGIDEGHTGRGAAHQTGLSSVLFHALFDAALSPERGTCTRIVAEAIAGGIDPNAIADQYIPAVAREMGDMWCADTMGFAEVTIGVARLQSLLRDLGPEWRADAQAAPDAPIILLISPRDAQHTLGCILLAGQLRRRGYSVRMALDPTREDLAHLIQRLRFDAIFVSASQSESLEKLRRMVDFLRTVSPRAFKLAIGGGVLEDRSDVAQLIGADVATSDIDEAIDYCGLTITQTPNAPDASRA